MNDALRIAKEVKPVDGYATRGKVMPTEEEMNALGEQLGEVRGTRVGRTIGRYQNAPHQEAVRTMYNDLLGLAKEGQPGRKWYENSSKRILQYFGGNKDAADKFAQLIAIYSPQTTVPINTSNAIKAYNRAMSGHQLWNGDIIDRDRTFNTIAEANKYAQSLGGGKAGITRVPLDDSGKRYLIARHKPGSYENIATADRDLKAHLLMNEGVPFEGRKTNNFWNNLMVHIDPKRLQGSTQDLWMAHAFGFPDVAIGSGGKYDFMEQLTHKLADQLGWRPHQVQAAIWTAIKTRMEATANDAKKAAVAHGIASMVPGDKGKPIFQVYDGHEDNFAELHRNMALGHPLTRQQIVDNAKDFSHFLDQNLANVSWESAPSKQIAHLNGIEDLSPEAKAEYHGRISHALQDDHGNDLLAKYLGIMSPGSVDAHGYWEGKTNPVTHLQVGSTRIKGAGQNPAIDEPSKDLMEVYAAAKGLLHKQDGVGYHRPFYNPKVTEANGMEYSFDNELTPEHIEHLGKQIDQHAPGTGMIPVNPRTVRMLNFSDQQGDQRLFHQAVDSVVSKAIPDTHSATWRTFGSDGNLVGNDWKVNPNGEDYIRRLRSAGRPDVLNYVSTVLAPRVEAVDGAFAQKHGLKTDPKVEQAVRNAHIEPPTPPSGPVGGFRRGGRTAYKKGGKVEGSIWHARDAFDEGGEIRAGDSVGGLRGDTGGFSEHDVGEAQGAINAATAAAQDARQGMQRMDEAFGPSRSGPETSAFNSGHGEPPPVAANIMPRSTTPGGILAGSQPPTPESTDYSIVNPFSAPKQMPVGITGIGAPDFGVSMSQTPQQMASTVGAEANAPAGDPNDPASYFGGQPSQVASATGTPAGSISAMQPQHYEPMANKMPDLTGVTMPAGNVQTAALSSPAVQPMAPHTLTPDTARTDLTGISAPAGNIQMSALPTPNVQPNAPHTLTPDTANASQPSVSSAYTETAPSIADQANAAIPTPMNGVPTPPIPLRDLQGPGIAEGIAGLFGLSTQQQFDKFYNGYIGQGHNETDAYNKAIGDIQTMRANAQPGPFDRSGKTQKIQKLMPDGTYQWVDAPYKRGGGVHSSQIVDHVLAKFGAQLPASNHPLFGNKAGRR